jgi:DNA-binding response OmpR family regulator
MTVSFHRGAKKGGKGRFIARGSFHVDLKSHRMQLNEESIQIPPCSFKYFVTLLKYSPNPVSYQKLVTDAQGYRLPRLEAQDLARSRVYLLRKALGENLIEPRYILAVPGFGYRLVTEKR